MSNAVSFDDDPRDAFTERPWFVDADQIREWEEDILKEEKRLERDCCAVNRGPKGQKWYLYRQSMRTAVCPVCLFGPSPVLAKRAGDLVDHDQVEHVCPFCGTWLWLVHGLTDPCPRWIILFPNAEFRVAVADLFFTPGGVSLTGLCDDPTLVDDDDRPEPERICGPGGDGAPPLVRGESS